MTFSLSSTTKRFAVVAGLLGISAWAGAPALANTHTDSMQSPAANSAQMNQPMNQPMNQQGAAANSIVDVASSSSSFNTLTQAVQAAGLTDTLANQGPYTVFAPTDEAFNQLPDGALEYLLQPENRDLLRRVLTYHVVPGEVTASEIRTGPVEALGGGLAVRVASDRVIVNNASVVNPDIQANNGVIHAVNRVLLPETLQQTLASRLGVETLYQ